MVAAHQHCHPEPAHSADHVDYFDKQRIAQERSSNIRAADVVDRIEEETDVEVDGIAELWYDNQAALARAVASPEMKGS